jgi:PAS domain S-box-containing protein
MKFLKQLNIRYKIVVIITFIGLVASFSGNLYNYFKEEEIIRSQIIANTRLQARLISEYCSLPLEFNYPDKAADVLDKLKAIPTIQDGLLFELSGKLFASYHTQAGARVDFPKELKQQDYFWDGDILYVKQKIVYKGRLYGFLYLRAFTDLKTVLKQKLNSAFLSGSGMFILVLILAFFFQSFLSSPIIKLTRFIEKVSGEKNYESRIDKESNDEIGELYEGFNELLELIAKRDADLNETLAALSYSEERFRLMVRNSYDIFTLADRTGYQTYVGPSAVTITGFSEHELKGPIQNFVHPDDSEHVMASFRHVIENPNTPVITEYRHIHKSKGYIWLESVAQNFLDGHAINAVVMNIRDISDRKTKEDELKQKNSELERFTYTVSHDLKSPLVTIKAFLGYLEIDMKKNDEPKIKKDIEYIKNAADKMGLLLDELLEYSRVGRKTNPPRDIAFNVLVNETIKLIAGRLSQNNIRIEVETVDITVQGDLPRLIEVFQNLIDNAAKFMGDQKSPLIRIGVEKMDNQTIFYVQDNGKGIDPRFRHKLFGLFEKLDANTDGTGVGLALIKRIIEFHGGKIWVDSDGLGKGSTFRFTLPAPKL